VITAGFGKLSSINSTDIRFGHLSSSSLTVFAALGF
jgi:hypothetical protein